MCPGTVQRSTVVVVLSVKIGVDDLSVYPSVLK